MSQAMEAARQESSGTKLYLLAGYYLLRGNFSLAVVLWGIILILAGLVVELFNGVMAGILGLWGISTIAFGVVMYAVLWANKKYAELQAS